MKSAWARVRNQKILNLPSLFSISSQLRSQHQERFYKSHKEETNKTGRLRRHKHNRGNARKRALLKNWLIDDSSVWQWIIWSVLELISDELHKQISVHNKDTRERVEQTALTASAKHKSVSDGWKMKILVLFPVSSLEEECWEGISEETTCSHHSILQIHHRRADSSWFIIWSLPLCKYFTDFSQWCNPDECTLLWIIGEMKC